MLVANWELLHDVLSVNGVESGVVYQLCQMVAPFPHICQPFLQILVDRLPLIPRDPFLVQAISNIA